MAAGNAGRKATLVLVSNLAGAALGYLALLLIGRYFSPDSYGIYLFALSLTGLLAIVSNLGLGAAHQRHIAQGEEAGRAFGVLVRLRLAVAMPILAVAALAYAGWSALRGRAFTDATTPLVLGLALGVQALSSTRQAIFDTWQGQQRVHRIEAVRTLDTVLAIALLGNAAALLAHLQGRWEVVPALGAFWARQLGLDAPPGLEQGAVLLAGCYLLAKSASLAVAAAWWALDRVHVGPWDRALARSYLRFALPLVLIGALALVLQYTDTLMLGFFWTAREVGLYGVAQRLSMLCLLGATAVGAVLFPRFAALHAAGDHQSEAAVFAKAERYLLLLVVPVAAAFVALPRAGLHVAVGDQYLDSAGPLRFLALWAVVGALEQSLSSRLLGAGRTRLLVRAAMFNAGGNVLLNLLFIPRQALGLGPAGAAMATWISTFATYLYLRHHGRALYGVPWIGRHQLAILAAGAVTAAAWAGAYAWAGPAAFGRFWQLGAWGAAGLALYAGLLWLLGELRRDDVAFLRSVAHPKGLLAEMRGR